MALFLLAKTNLLPTTHFVALRPSLPFRQAQYVQVSPLKPAPFCRVFAGPGSTNKSAISLLRLSLCSRQLSGRNFLLVLPVLPSYNGSPHSRLTQETTRLMSWPDGERYLCFVQSLVVTFVSSLISILVFSRTGGVLSRLNFLTHRLPRFPLKNLCSLVTLAVPSLVFAATGTAFYLTRIGRIENPSYNASKHPSLGISHLILHCSASDSLHRLLFGDSLSLYDLWSRPWRVSRLLGLHGLPPCPHSLSGVG